MKLPVVTASKHPEPLSEAPSTITVIPRERIVDSGARYLSDLLREVPGVTLRTSFFGEELIEMRGYTSESSSNSVLLLVDGIVRNQPYSGGATLVFDDLALENVERIEVARGPGSSLWGPNAYAGIINVVTRRPGSRVTEARLSAGSWGTWNGSIFHGDRKGDLRYSLFADTYRSDGDDLVIEADALSGLKDAVGAPLSRAPGAAPNRTHYKVTTQVRVDYKDFSFNGGFLRKSFDVFVGNGFAVVDLDRFTNTEAFVNLGWRRGWSASFETEAHFTFTHSREFEDTELGPRAVYPDDTGDGIPEDFSDRGPGWHDIIKTNSWFLELRGSLTDLVVKEDRLDVGLEGRFIDQYHILDVENVDYEGQLFGGRTPWLPHPDWWNTPAEQRVGSANVQYRIKRGRIVLTGGARADAFHTRPTDLANRPGHRTYRFSSFNPRASVVFSPSEATDVRLIFASGFRNPAFREFYNQPTEFGGARLPDLEPERIQAYEVSVGHRISQTLYGRSSLFFNHLTDRLQLVGVSPAGAPFFTNRGEIEGFGGELELLGQWPWGRAFLNYTYLDMEDETGGVAPAMARHKFNLGLRGKWRAFTADAVYHRVGSRQGYNVVDRQLVPDRSFPSYGLLDLKLARESFPVSRASVELIGHNVLDEDYVDPSDRPEIPGEYPREGRSLWLGVRLALD